MFKYLANTHSLSFQKNNDNEVHKNRHYKIYNKKDDRSNS